MNLPMEAASGLARTNLTESSLMQSSNLSKFAGWLLFVLAFSELSLLNWLNWWRTIATACERFRDG